MRYRGFATNIIDIHVQFYGAGEKHILYFLRDFCTTKKGADCVFVDIGANTGLYSLFMSKHARLVHSFEPYPPVLARFCESVRLNGITNVFIHSVGLGDKTQTLPFYEPPSDNLGIGSFLEDWDSRLETRFSLRIVRGDDYFDDLEIPDIDLIKMDIEGFEQFALRGLRQTLDRHRPVVVVEVTVRPGVDGFFSSREHLLAAFPENYGLRHFETKEVQSGAYRVIPFHFAFDRFWQFDVVAFPLELSETVPTKYEGDH